MHVAQMQLAQILLQCQLTGSTTAVTFVPDISFCWTISTWAVLMAIEKIASSFLLAMDAAHKQQREVLIHLDRCRSSQSCAARQSNCIHHSNCCRQLLQTNRLLMNDRQWSMQLRCSPHCIACSCLPQCLKTQPVARLAFPPSFVSQNLWWASSCWFTAANTVSLKNNGSVLPAGDTAAGSDRCACSMYSPEGDQACCINSKGVESQSVRALLFATSHNSLVGYQNTHWVCQNNATKHTLQLVLLQLSHTVVHLALQRCKHNDTWPPMALWI